VKDRIKGKVEQTRGKLTGDKVEELKGKARQKAGEGKQAAKELGDRPERKEPLLRDQELLDDHADDTPESS
jgi:uncharacterized protein YjbJ (UPF0337 family)